MAGDTEGCCQGEWQGDETAWGIVRIAASGLCLTPVSWLLQDLGEGEEEASQASVCSPAVWTSPVQVQSVGQRCPPGIGGAAVPRRGTAQDIVCCRDKLGCSKGCRGVGGAGQMVVAMRSEWATGTWEPGDCLHLEGLWGLTMAPAAHTCPPQAQLLGGHPVEQFVWSQL